MERLSAVVCVVVFFLSSGVRAAPDLTISNFTATVEDRNVTFDGQVCNVGQDDGTTGFYVGRWKNLATQPSCGMTPDESSLVWNNLTHKSLPAGGCLPSGFTILHSPVGTFQAWQMADHTCAVTETTEDNNVVGVSYTVPPPDMWVKSFVVTVNGNQADYSFEICNQGTSAQLSFYVGLYIDSPTAPSCSDTSDQGMLFPNNPANGISFAAGTCSQSSGSFPITPGNHTAWFVVDNTCALPEAERSNNALSASYTLAAPDLGVPDVGPPDAGPPDGAPPDMSLADAAQCNFNGTCDGGESCPCPDCCTCSNPVTAGVSATLSGGFDTLVKCPPIFKGDAGVKVAITGTASTQVAGCPTCKAETKTSASLSAELHLCDVTFSAEGGGDYTWAKQYCIGCDPTTCEQQCLDTFCAQESSSLQAKLGVSRFFGFKVGSTEGPIGAQLACGVDAGGSFGGKITDEETEDGGCAPCQQCKKTSGELTLGLNATGSCGLTVKVGAWEPKIGCEDCVNLGVDFTGGASQQSGACGEQDCTYGKIGANASFSLSQCIDVLWFQVALGCSGKATGECSSDTCGASGCKHSTDLTCGVTGEGDSCD